MRRFRRPHLVIGGAAQGPERRCAVAQARASIDVRRADHRPSREASTRGAARTITLTAIERHRRALAHRCVGAHDARARSARSPAATSDSSRRCAPPRDGSNPTATGGSISINAGGRDPDASGAPASAPTAPSRTAGGSVALNAGRGVLLREPHQRRRPRRRSASTVSSQRRRRRRVAADRLPRGERGDRRQPSSPSPSGSVTVLDRVDAEGIARRRHHLRDRRRRPGHDRRSRCAPAPIPQGTGGTIVVAATTDVSLAETIFADGAQRRLVHGRPAPTATCDDDGATAGRRQPTARRRRRLTGGTSMLVDSRVDADGDDRRRRDRGPRR